MQIHWHRRDLRAGDNVALSKAASQGSVLPVFIFDPELLDIAGSPRVAAMLDALKHLRSWYREQGSDLLVKHGNPREILPELAEEYDATGVTWNRAYTKIARERDADVRQVLDDHDITRNAYHDAVHHKPGSITTNNGDPYSVYTYYWKKWRDRDKESSYGTPDKESLVEITGKPLPTLSDLDIDQPEATVPEIGTELARKRLSEFCDGPIYEYEEKRDYPAAECTSRLSADLTFGTIGIREVYERTQEAYENAETDSEEESVQEFQSQLGWREFYIQVLWANPDLVTENFKEYENEIQWRSDPEALQAWKDGKTGYPIVDAGMRQLREEAYMHNRVRMIVASFLTKDLLIDWREGYKWFKEKLSDHNTANNNGGWQWAASTGTDAQPYFRIFNPMSQGERYDPDAEYIKKYVPELQDADPEVIHSWNECSLTQRRRAASDYPDPIVDHSEQREKAMQMFKRARGDLDD